jgi:RNA polymerase sigma-70 factor (ECF subfamily)
LTAGDLDAMLHDVVDAAQRACPTLRLPVAVFISYLRERLPSGIAPAVALRRLHISDLYLACACAQGDHDAFAAFDVRCLSPLDRVLGKMGIDARTIAEVKQDIRVRVLVGAGRRPEIVDFAGRGDLRGWVRVMAAREALRRESRARREVAIDEDDLVHRAVAPENPERDYLNGLYRNEFKRAFESALRALPSREQTLLRQHYVDGATLDDLARLYRVHRSTAAHQLARVRVRVLEATRDQLMSRLALTTQDLDSILRMIWSRIEISLRALRRRRR